MLFLRQLSVSVSRGRNRLQKSRYKCSSYQSRYLHISCYWKKL